MEDYLKLTAAVLIAAIIGLILRKHSGDISLLLTVAVCCMVVTLGVHYLQPVLTFARSLIAVGNLDYELLNVLLKVVGIGLLSQIATLICTDAGNQTLGKALQIMTTAVILCVSVPILEQMLSLIQEILGEV